MKDPPSGKIPTFFLTLPLFTCQTTNTQKWYNISLCEKGHRFQHYLEKKFKSHVASTRILLIMMKSLNIRTSRRKRTVVSCFFNILVYKAECVCACVTVSHKMLVTKCWSQNVTDGHNTQSANQSTVTLLVTSSQNNSRTFNYII